MKRVIKIGLMLIIALGFKAVSQAAVSDALTVTITPNAFYAVDIDTAAVDLDLGTIALGASTQTVSPATVTIQSTFASTDLRLQGGITSSGTAWEFDVDDTSSQESDAIAAWASFTDVNRSSAPSQTGDFFNGTSTGTSNTDVISTLDRYVGTSAGDSTTDCFEVNSGGNAKDMDGLPPSPDANAQSHLWLYFRLPNATTDTDAQNIKVTLTAVAPN